MYKRILVPVDGSASSMSGLNEAVRLARTGRAKLRILHVVDGIALTGEHGPFTATAESFRESGRKLIQEVRLRVKKQPVQADALIVENLLGRAAESIVKEAGRVKEGFQGSLWDHLVEHFQGLDPSLMVPSGFYWL